MRGLPYLCIGNREDSLVIEKNLRGEGIIKSSWFMVRQSKKLLSRIYEGGFA